MIIIDVFWLWATIIRCIIPHLYMLPIDTVPERPIYNKTITQLEQVLAEFKRQNKYKNIYKTIHIDSLEGFNDAELEHVWKLTQYDYAGYAQLESKNPDVREKFAQIKVKVDREADAAAEQKKMAMHMAVPAEISAHIHEDMKALAVYVPPEYDALISDGSDLSFIIKEYHGVVADMAARQQMLVRIIDAVSARKSGIKKEISALGHQRNLPSSGSKNTAVMPVRSTQLQQQVHSGHKPSVGRAIQSVPHHPATSMQLAHGNRPRNPINQSALKEVMKNYDDKGNTLQPPPQTLVSRFSGAVRNLFSPKGPSLEDMRYYAHIPERG
ncbi:MAG: hypothetical protein JWM56_527 [Candidatus Peribacteria bacterium]|nr:hypothetical protein [Candidatus Peribacteria bacterium]